MDRLKITRKNNGDYIIITPYGFTVEIPAADIAKISISKSNKKMDIIPSVSLPAIVTCFSGAPCARPGSPCYAQHMEKNTHHSSIIKSYYKNLLCYLNDPDGYFLQVKAAAAVSGFFRYHVSGDIPDADYFARMIDAAETVKHCHFLAFTKQYKIINDFLDAGGVIPNNLHVIFSNWYNWKCPNPHGLAACEIVDNINTAPGAWYKCGGSCAACCMNGAGCFFVKPGEIIAIQKH